jgi:hypothetical protein
MSLFKEAYMFCPKCKAEYSEGFKIGSDCNVQLVHELQEPEEVVPEFIDYEQVLGTYNAGDIAIIKSLLDAEGITYFFKGEHFMYVRPLADPVRLMVKKDEVEDAMAILQDANLSFRGINVDIHSQETEDDDS